MPEEPSLPPEPEELMIRPPRLRRQLLMGTGATASLILTLANRPALAAKACDHSTWLSWKGELTHPSQEPSPCTGDSKATWATNAASLWAPSWGIAYLKTAKFSTTFFSGASTFNGWAMKSGSTDTLLGALQDLVTLQHGTGNNIATYFAAQATAGLLNCNFYGASYGSAANSQTPAALITEVQSKLPSSFSTAMQNAITAFTSKYFALNTA